MTEVKREADRNLVSKPTSKIDENPVFK